MTKAPPSKKGIEWTDATWNPIVGCSVISPGCTNCYAMRMAARLEAMGTVPHYSGTTQPSRGGAVWTGKLAVAPPHIFEAPLKWRKPRLVFVNSMGDLFHDDAPRKAVAAAFRVMEEADHHVYQVLTKRPQNMQRFMQERYGSREIPTHIWPGVSVENQRHTARLVALRAINSPARFVSFEPLLGHIYAVDLTAIAWAIVGGESGPGHRPMNPEWVRHLRAICERDNVAFFFKQWGGARGKANGRTLDGRTHDELPRHLLNLFDQQTNP